VGEDGLWNRFGMTRAPDVLKVSNERFYSSNGMAYFDNVSGSEGIELRGGEFLEEFLPRHACTSNESPTTWLTTLSSP
jgi:hypothetical protein